MFTIFAVPKSFQNNTQIIQENAISSWKSLHPEIEVVLYGDEEGIREVTKKYDCLHREGVEKSEYGTPQLNSIFQDIKKIARHDVLCYCNADIILLNDIVPVIQSFTPMKEFLLVGRRINIDLNERIETNDATWEKRIRTIIQINGKVGRADQIDCFIFPRNLMINMPPFAVGRGGWDNWLIANMRKRKVPVIDVTGSFPIIHQNHGYHHVPNQKGNAWEGPETDRNRELMEGLKNLYTIDDADWIYTKEGLKKKGITFGRIYRDIWRNIK